MQQEQVRPTAVTPYADIGRGMQRFDQAAIGFYDHGRRSSTALGFKPRSFKIIS
jgi:hypothetical protein